MVSGKLRQEAYNPHSGWLSAAGGGRKNRVHIAPNGEEGGESGRGGLQIRLSGAGGGDGCGRRE